VFSIKDFIAAVGLLGYGAIFLVYLAVVINPHLNLYTGGGDGNVSVVGIA